MLFRSKIEDQHTHIPVETYYAPSIPPSTIVEQKELASDPMIAQPEIVDSDLSMYNDERLVSKFDKESGFVSPNAPGLDVTMDRPGDYLTDNDKAARTAWKEANPGETIKHQRDLYEKGVIDQLPWLGLDADNINSQGNVTGFGIDFPANPAKGDMYLRVDQMPSVLYKYNGRRWIEVDKNRTDQYAYDDA